MFRTAGLMLLLSCGAVFAEPPIAGRWRGEWVSDQNGHRGALRANVTPTTDGYDVRFSGRFAKVIPFTYRQHLTQTGSDGERVYLAAERRLPLFGTFRMMAEATANTFDARFSAGQEQGRFKLQR